jgi:hypothetical protein
MHRGTIGTTVVFGSIYPWGSQLRLAADLRRHGCRVERVAASGESRGNRLRSGIERLVYHRVERSLGSDYEPSSLRLDALVRALDAGVLDLQLDDWLAASLTHTHGDHPNFRRRTRAPFRELDIYDKVAMTEHAAGSGWAVPQTFSSAAAVDDRWPKIVKPKLGGGGHGIQVVHSSDECLRAIDILGGWSEVIVQQFIDGPSVRVAGIARDGELVRVLTYRTAKPADDPYGPSIGVAVSPIPGLVERAQALLAPMGYTGIFGIESICTPDGVPRFIEMNSRVLASLTVLSSAGVDLVDDYLYALGARAEPATGRIGETAPLRVDSVQLFWRVLGPRWAVAELSLRFLTWLGRQQPFTARSNHPAEALPS